MDLNQVDDWPEFIAVFIASLFLFSLFAYSLLYSPSLDVISSTTSIFLTLGLVWLYHENNLIQSTQTDIQKKQTGILEEQSKLQRAEYEPIISVEHQTIDSDRIRIWITNYGDDIAKSLSVNTYVEVLGVNDQFQCVPKRLSMDSDDDDNRKGDMIDANSEMVPFIATPQVKREVNQGAEYFSISRLTGSIIEGESAQNESRFNGIEVTDASIRFGCWVEYEDRFGKEYREEIPHLCGLEFSTDKAIGLEEAIEGMDMLITSNILWEYHEQKEERLEDGHAR